MKQSLPTIAGNRDQPSLCELLDRVLNTGVVARGEIIVSVAGIDLIYLNLNLLLTSVETAMNQRDLMRDQK